MNRNSNKNKEKTFGPPTIKSIGSPNWSWAPNMHKQAQDHDAVKENLAVPNKPMAAKP